MGWSPYNKYLDNLRAKQKENPYYNQAVNQSRQLAHPWQQMSENLAHKTHQGYLTESALADLNLKSNQEFSNMQNQIYNNANLMQQQRQDNIDDKIFELDHQKELYLKQKEDEKKAKKKSWLSTGLQVGGAAIGGLVGGLPGASIGASLGGIVGGIATDETQVAMQGFADTLGGISSMSSLNYEKTLFSNMQKINLNAMDIEKLTKFNLILNTGNREMIENYMNSLL